MYINKKLIKPTELQNPKIKTDKLLQSVGIPLMLLDCKGKIISANKEAGKLFSLTTEKLIGKQVKEFFTNLTPSFINSVQRIRKIKTSAVTKNKFSIDFELVINPFQDNRKKFYTVTINDNLESNSDVRKAIKRERFEQLDTKKLRALFENVDVLLWSVRRDEKGSYYYEKVNEAFSSVTGRKPSDYDGILLRKLGSDAEYKSVVHSLDVAKEKGVYEYERTLIHMGEKKYFVIRIIYLEGDNNTEYYIGYASDVTLVKKSEELLKLSEKKYHSLTANAPIALTKVDPFSGKFLYVNNEFIKQSGYSLEDFNALSAEQTLNLIHPDDQKRISESNSAWNKNGYKGIWHDQYRGINKYGKVLWLDAYFYAEYSEDGKVAAVNQMYLDITESKRIEELLRLSEKIYKDLATFAPIGIAHTSFKTGLYEFVNNEFIRQSGYSMEEFNSFTQEQLDQIIHPEDRERHKNELQEWLKGGMQGVFHIKYRAINKCSEVVWLEAFFYPEFDEDKNPVSINQIYIDITQMKIAEDEIKHSLLEKELLLKEVYHRVKNNLQVINSLLNLQSGVITDPIAKEIFKESQRRIKIMSMIHEKLYSSKDLTKIDFSNYIYSLVNHIRDSYPVSSNNIILTVKTKNISLGLNKSISCGLIINELVSNSYKYAFEQNKKGIINVELFMDNDEFYILIVEDNGKGFPVEIDFNKTESLGMVIVNSFVKQLQGTIELDRTCGTKFIIKFPV